MSIIDTIKDYIETFTHQLTSVDRQITQISENVERRINRQVKKVKKELTSTILFLSFLFLTMLFLGAGLVVFMYRFMPLDVALLIFGIIFAFIAMLVKLLN